MKKNKINFIAIISIIAILFSTGCVSTRTAPNLNKAEKRIIQYNTGIQNQIKAYPQLTDKSFKITEIIKVEIPADSLKLHLLLNDFEKLKELNRSIEGSYKETEYKLDSLDNLINNKDFDLNNNRHIVKTLTENLRKLNESHKLLYKQYTENCLVDQDGTYVDEKFIVDYRFVNGILSLDIVSKEKEVEVETIKEQYNIKIRRHFWQDIKFWGFILVLFNIIYFFPDIIKNTVSSLLGFVRKLFIKI